MKTLDAIERKIAEHVGAHCDACSQSVTAFTPVCPILANLYREARAAAKARALT